MSWWFSSAAFALTPVVLIGPDLEARPAHVQGLRDGVLTYFDQQRLLRTGRLEEFLQVRLAGDAERPATASALAGGALGSGPAPVPAPAPALTPAPGRRGIAVVELVDGQRLPGQLLGPAADGQGLRLRHALLGECTISLEDLRALALTGPLPEAPRTEGAAVDAVTLANGDRLEGFLVGVKNEGFEFQPRGQDAKVVLPVERVASVRLASAAKPQARPGAGAVPGAAGHGIWLRDGSRLRGVDLAIQQDTLTFAPVRSGAATQPGNPGAGTPRLAPVRVPLKEVRRIEVASAAGRLVDLVDLPMKVTAGGEVFGLAMPPRVEGRALWLHAPVTVEFALPPGAVRFAARAEDGASAGSGPGDVPGATRPEGKAPGARPAAPLPEDAPGTTAAAWRDFAVSLSVDDQPIARAVLDDRHPRQRFNVPMQGRRLIIQLDTGRNGPVLDRLWLLDAAVLVQNQGQ